jgi:hypothetical protein
MKKVLLVILLAVNFIVVNCYAQPTMDWVKGFGGTGADVGTSIAVDSYDNVYSTGVFQGIVDFDPGTATYNLSSTGGYDVFVSKFDSAGNFIWAKAMGGSGDDWGNSIVADASGNVYITGSFDEEADFDPGVGTFVMLPVGGKDLFVCKINSTGDFAWAKSIGATNWEESFSICIDTSANIYMTGYFNETVDFDPGTAIFNLYCANGNSDIFVLKLDSSGNFIWAKRNGSSSSREGAYSIAVDDSNNIYTAGYTAITSSHDIYITKQNSLGGFVWTKTIVGNSDNDGRGITVDATGNVYITGYFWSQVDFDPGPGIFNLTSMGTNVFILKLDAGGNFVWAKQMGGGSGSRPYSITKDEFNNIYTVGYFWGTADFDPNATTYYLTSAGLGDVFISKLNSSGSFIWAKKTGGSATDESYSVKYSQGKLFLTGKFSSPSITIDADTLTNAGSSDIFIGKLNSVTCTFPTASTIINNVTCHGGSNGSAYSTPSGGTPPYTYLWTPSSQTGQTATNLSAGIYTCYVSDSVGCSTSTTLTITQPPFCNPQPCIGNNVSCFGGNNGCACVNTCSGVPPFTYTWTPNVGNTATACNLGAGNYTVTITDSYGCTRVATAIVTQPAQLLAQLNASYSSPCFGDTVCIMPTVTGGVPPYSYLWNTGDMTAVICPNQTGSYACTIWDANGCSTQVITSVSYPPPFYSDTATVNATCSTCNDGMASVTTNGGTPPYSYMWNTSPSQTTPTATGLLPGMYTCCVTDANGCSTCSGVVVSSNCSFPSLQASNITFSNVTSSSMTVNWTNGDGNRRIVKIKTTNTFTAPANGNDYLANSVYTGSEQVVYNGTGNSVNVTGLSSATFYWFRIYEANCSGNSSLYITGPDAGNPKRRRTLPYMNPNRPEEIAVSNVASSLMIVPNPAHINFVITLNEEFILPGTELKIYDITGRLMHEQSLSHQSTIIDKQFSPGVYLVKVNAAEKVYTEKLVVQ